MPKVVGIKLGRTPKTYWFEAGEWEYALGKGVVVDTARGREYGKVVIMPKDIAESEVVGTLRPVVALASAEDEARVAEQESKRGEILRLTAEKIEKHKLNMKPVDAEYTFDGSKLVIYFTADARVDFRELVKELASVFHIRIELRQIGARDECKMLGGIAPCGRACCCSDHMSEYAKVSIKMAKNQNLSLNPTKISGLCGRLMCCLAYENNHYVETNKRMPKLGGEVTAPDGRKGTATGINQLKETVKVKFVSGEKVDFEEFPLSDLRFRARGCAVEQDPGDDEDAVDMNDIKE